MYVFDSDHLSILQRQAGEEFGNLMSRCSATSASDFFITIVSFHEQVNGWAKYVARAKDALVGAWICETGRYPGQLRPCSSAALQRLSGRRVRGAS